VAELSVAQRSHLMNCWYLPLACFFVAIACALSAAADQRGMHRIKIDSGRIGSPPANFEFLRTGEGKAGTWTVVGDSSAGAGIAIEHFSEDQTERRYSVAVYKPLSIENFAVRARVKVIEGTMQSASLAVRVQDSNNDYVVSASALEGRIDLFRVVDGKTDRIGGTEAAVVTNRWHLIALAAADDRFTVAVDNKRLFSVSDRTFLQEGRIGLWVEEDNLSRFAQIEISAVPRSGEL
jgi:hypothetical protein